MFAADNGLHVGDFVVFRHEGERVFDVSIFEPSHCEREYPLPHGGFSVPQPSKNFEDLNQKSAPDDEGSVPDLERAVKVEHPFFVSTLHRYSLNSSRLYLPIEFARSNGLVGSGKREMILKDDKERSWSVVLGRTGYNFGLFRGWHDFQMANGLKEGDAYKFELIESGKKPIAKFHNLNQKSVPVDEESVPNLERAVSNKQPVSNSEHKRAFTSKDDHPFFVSTLHHYNLKLSHLNIPSDFARENGLWNRQCKMILRDLNQRSWPVELGYTRNRASIKHGWDKFCGANGLVEGDTFVFKLIDNGETPIAKVYVQGTASTMSSCADHRHFVSTIKPYCLKKRHLYLPIEFARSNGLAEAGKRDMILRNDKERSWLVVLGRIGHHFGIIRGWHDFHMANDLKEGDAYKFELIESGKKPVAIFHCHFSGQEN